MAGSIEHQLLSRIVQFGAAELHTATKMKINRDFFFVPECKELFIYLFEHYMAKNTYGQVPSWSIVQQHFPSFPFSWGIPDGTPTLCEELRKQRLRAQIYELADKIQQNAAVDPRTALAMVRDASSSLSAQHDLTDDLALAHSAEILRQEYDLVSSGKGITGIPYPWAVLNEDTMGMHPGEFIIIYGRPKSMKTWVGLLIATLAYFYGNRRVLVYSLEMKVKQVLRRCAAILAQVDYEKLRTGKLNQLDEQRVFEMLTTLSEQEQYSVDQLGHMPSLLATSDDDEGGGGISSLTAKIEEFKPDLVVVDGFYLMRDDRSKTRMVDWKATANISRDLKRLAKQTNLPIIGITQANRSASKDAKHADLTELSYADALGQDCDVCMRIVKKEDPATHEPELELGFPGSREGKLDAFVINGTPAINFTFKRMITASDSPPPPNGSNGGGRSMPSVPNFTGRRIQ